MSSRLPLRVPPALILALVAILLFAATAAAETKIGEGTSPELPSLAGEADLLKASASYDLSTGSVTFETTTRLAPESMPEAERPEVEYIGALVSTNFPCTREGFEAEAKKAEEEGTNPTPFPIIETFSANRPITEPPPGLPPAQAYWLFAEHEEGGGGPPENYAVATKTMNGTTATVNATDAGLAGQPFNCAEVVAETSEGEEEPDIILFGLTPKPEPAPVETVPPASAPAASTPAPAPAPGVLSIAKAKRPLELRVGRWATVKVTVTNTGGTTTTPGSLQLKASKGVLVKPARQKLPALLPGGSWTVSYRVKLTANAKARSTLSLVGSAGTVPAKGSLVVKRTGH